MIPCICINDTGRPKEIPINKWVKKGEKYTITYVYWMVKQNFRGVDLAEIELDETNKPYTRFALSRFAIPHDKLQEFIELCKACTEMNDFDLEETLRQIENTPSEVPAEKELETV